MAISLSTRLHFFSFPHRAPSSPGLPLHLF